MGRDWVRAFIGLGANAGDPLAQIEQAFDALLKLPATVGLQRSRLYRTAPWQAQGPDFINAMAQVDTQLSELNNRQAAFGPITMRPEPWIWI
jgi:2-amino-4-hydroxy-6-hydroxymethyldihydropteridine diphosphokinase